jgi:hypothetical protein
LEYGAQASETRRPLLTQISQQVATSQTPWRTTSRVVRSFGYGSRNLQFGTSELFELGPLNSAPDSLAGTIIDRSDVPILSQIAISFSLVPIRAQTLRRQRTRPPSNGYSPTLMVMDCPTYSGATKRAWEPNGQDLRKVCPPLRGPHNNRC